MKSGLRGLIGLVLPALAVAITHLQRGGDAFLELNYEHRQTHAAIEESRRSNRIDEMWSSAPQVNVTALTEPNLDAPWLAGLPGWWAISLARAIIGAGALEKQSPSFTSSYLMWRFLGLTIAFGLLYVAVKKAIGEEEEKNSGKINSQVDIDQWRIAAEKGGLDLYTCMALSLGRSKGATFRKFLPRMLALFCLQLVVGVLLLFARMQMNATAGNPSPFHVFPVTDGFAFRTIGLILFAYSCYNLITSMDDDCRTILVQYLETKHSSGWYEWPLIWGELMNTIIGIILMVILYAIFCQTKRPEGLLMNCIAVNFVADIDNDMVTDEDTDEAIENLGVAVEEWDRDGHSDINTMTTSDRVQMGFMVGNDAVRYLLPFVATTFTVLFSFGSNQYLCDNLKAVSEWPFCVGLST